MKINILQGGGECFDSDLYYFDVRFELPTTGQIDIIAIRFNKGIKYML